MKIKTTRTVETTEIEADARELRESNTLGQNFGSMLSRIFQSKETWDDYDDAESEDTEEEDDT